MACLKDILQFVQAGVCTAGDAGGGGQEGEHGMMTIGRVMDWVEARLEAIKCTDEEEEEERVRRESGPGTDVGATSGPAQQRTKDEKEKDTRRRSHLPSSQNMHNVTPQMREGPSSSSSFSKARNGRVNKDSMVDPQPSSSSPRLSHSVSPAPPNFSAATNLSSPSPPPQLGPALRSSTRSKRNAGAAMSPVFSTVSIPTSAPSSHSHPYTHTHESSQSQSTASGMIPPSSAPAFTFAPEVVTALPPVSITAAVAGTKRRHAMMAAAAAFAAGGAVAVDPSGGGVGGGDASSNSSTNSTTSGGPHAHGRGPRRRGGHYGRGKVAPENALQLQNGYDSMDVEEDGRERKRIARR